MARAARSLSVGEQDSEHALCAAVVGIVEVRAAAVVLMTTGGRVVGNVCVTDGMAKAVEELQYTVGEGPGVDACHTGRPVLVPDLGHPDETRWTGFREGALEAGVCAAFGFPLLIGPVSIGALDLYHDRPGPLSAEQLADAAAVADVVGRTVIGWQASAERRSVAWQLEQVPAHMAAVHQAAGMVSVQARISVDDATASLRAYAFAERRRISDVVTDVVERRLRFDESPPNPVQ